MVVVKQDLSVAAMLCLGETELLRQQHWKGCNHVEVTVQNRCELMFTANFAVGCPLCAFACARLRQRPSGACSWSGLPADSLLGLLGADLLLWSLGACGLGAAKVLFEMSEYDSCIADSLESGSTMSRKRNCNTQQETRSKGLDRSRVVWSAARVCTVAI